MIDGQIFYHSTIRKTVVAFGELFNNIRVRRINSAGDTVQTLKIPLSYGPKQKFLVRIRQNPDLATRSRIEISVPRLGFEITNISYDASRKLAPTQRSKHIANDGSISTMYNPSPWNIHFQLHALVRNQDDGLQILEQILPFFNPEYVVRLNDVPDMGLKHDLPIVLEGVTYEDNYEGDFLERNAIVWTLQFTAKANIYGPVYGGAGVIKKAIATVWPNMPGEPELDNERYTATVDPLSAGPTDTYTILETWDKLIQ